jgi:hypothetical protein
MTDCNVTSGSISIPNPVRTGDAFVATFTFNANNILPESFIYKIYSVLPSGEPTLMAMATEDFLIPVIGQTKQIVCNGNLSDGCGYIFEPTPPAGTHIAIYVEVTPQSTPDGYARYHLGDTVTAPDNGMPLVSVANLPTKVVPLQEVSLLVTLEATGTGVTNPEIGVTQIDGPQIQYKGSNDSWMNLSADEIYTGPVISFLSGGTGIDVTLHFRMPDAGLFDSNTGKAATICIVGARLSSDGVSNIPYPPATCRTTFIQKSTITCTDNAERCAKNDGTLGGCIRQVCHSNAWITVIEHDPTCPGCELNRTCGGKPAGTVECGHPNTCSRYACNGLTGVWDMTIQKDTTCAASCLDPVCTSGQSSCDAAVTKKTSCEKYNCTSGQWMKASNQGLLDCGAGCLAQNPILIAGVIGTVAIAAGIIYYISSGKKPAKKTLASSEY